MNPGELLDPELAEAAGNVPPLLAQVTRSNLSGVRAIMTQMKAGMRQPVPEVEAMEREIPGTSGVVKLHIFQPRNAPENLPCLLWVHGGGYVMGDGDDLLCPGIAQRMGCKVVSVDYRLAPEHPFPAGAQDCHDALLWVHREAASLGIDPERIAIGGASAGAGMAAGVTLMNRDRRGPNLCFQFLLYPMLDNLHDTASGKVESHVLWNRETSLNAWEMYLDGTPGLDASPYAAASRAADLAALPPACVVVGGQDLFRDECIDYAQRLMAAQVPTQLAVFPGVFHSAEILVPQARISQRMNACMDDALRNGLWCGKQAEES